MTISVVAKANGYYGGKIREPGEKFEIADDEAFSDVWMQREKEAEVPIAMRHVNTGGTDGVVGAEVPKRGQKVPAKERIAAAKQLTGREDIDTAAEADKILAAANTGSDNDDRSRDFASDPSNDAPVPEPATDDDAD